MRFVRSPVRRSARLSVWFIAVLSVCTLARPFVRRQSGSLLSRFVPSSESRKQSIREGSRSPPSEYKDLESAGSANIAATAPAATAAGARPPAVSLSGPGQDNDGAAAAVAVPLRRSASTWSSRDLVKRAEGLPRVRVTPAWSLNAALGTMSSSSPTTKDASTTTASSIVQEVAAARSSGLVICGCAGSGQLPVSDRPEAAPAEGVNGVRAIGGAPLAGANSVHGKWPSLGPLSRSRHNPTLSTRSWHGKARPLGGRSLHSSRHGAGGAKVSGVRGNGRGGLASAVDNVIHSALVDIVGDVAGGLARAEREPAVLAVRASIPATKTATV